MVLTAWTRTSMPWASQRTSVPEMLRPISWCDACVLSAATAGRGATKSEQRLQPLKLGRNSLTCNMWAQNVRNAMPRHSSLSKQCSCCCGIRVLVVQLKAAL